MLRGRALFSLAVFGVAMLLLSRYGRAIRTPQMVPYTNREIGFTVSLPRDWLVRDERNLLEQQGGLLGVEPVLVVLKQPHGTETKFNSNVIVSVREMSEIPSTADSQKVAKLAGEVLESIVVPKGSGATRTFESNGLSGAQSNIQYIQEFQGNRVNLTASVAALVSTHHRRCFLITATAPAEDFEQYQPVFQNRIGSFRET